MRIDVERITPRQKLTIAKGLCEYEYIMENWKNDDTDFREVYYEFYADEEKLDELVVGLFYAPKRGQ